MIDRLNRRTFLAYGTAAFASSLLIKSCASPPPEATESGDAEATSDTPESSVASIAIVLPGVITDGGWNQLGYEGVKTVADDLGSEFAYVEKVAQADQTEQLGEFARQGYGVVVGHGGQFDAAIEQVSADFPDTFFLGVNGNVSGSNYASVQTNYNQMAYLAGVIAATMSDSKKLAYMTGLEFKSTQQQGKAMELGAKSVDPTAEVAVTYVGDFNDIAKAKEAALALMSSGVDVIFHNLDNSAPAVLQAASDNGIYAIGNAVDQYELAPDAVLTSMVQNIGGAITYVADLAAQGEAEGKKYVIGLETPELISLGTFNEAVPDELKQQVEELQAAMVDGKLTFEDAEEDGKASVIVVES
ncbi:MAG: BMP family protein [Cyanobacteria bacterium P01_A01_bin.37]